MPLYRLTIESEDEAIMMEFPAADDDEADEKAKKRMAVVERWRELNPKKMPEVEYRLMRWNEA